MNDRERAESILRIHPSPQIVARVSELGRRADAGTLTDDERREYQALVDLGDLLATLKLKARRFLDESPE